MIISEVKAVREEYQKARERRWVLPCICTENLTTTEAILKAAKDYQQEHSVKNIPVIIAATCLYDHRSQIPNYTHTRDGKTGLKLFTNDIKALADENGYYRDLNVMIHLDHIQHDLDTELLEGDLSDYASILYDASGVPFEENIRKTAAFVEKRGGDILVEGACDEIVDATGNVHNELTSPQKAKEYAERTGVDLIVANLGTEHRATGKQLQYHGDVARSIKAEIGEKIVLHGTSSVTNEQVRGLFDDGVIKVNVWTALERDSAPVLFEEMIKNAVKIAGVEKVEELIAAGYLTEKAKEAVSNNIGYFTTVFRQDVIYRNMEKIVKDYFDMWYR